jgi:hypothetical protein
MMQPHDTNLSRTEFPKRQDSLHIRWQITEISGSLLQLAKALGLDVPRTLLAAAVEVLE